MESQLADHAQEQAAGGRDVKKAASVGKTLLKAAAAGEVKTI